MLPPQQQLVAADKWPLVGERTPSNDTGPWQLSITGLVRLPQVWSVEELIQLPSVARCIDLHCVTRWSKLQVPWHGVLLSTLLELAQPLPTARFISFVARSTRAHSTSLDLATALELETLIAWEAEGRPLETAHGGPLRSVVPGRYFYKSLKWLTKIELLAEDRLGHWEAEAGYHNNADPWAEERYIAPGMSKQFVTALLSSRNWSGQELRSLQTPGMNLSGLVAQETLLRDADLNQCNLTLADFRRANLSNARLRGANLTLADFRDSDCEGADFRGADLRSTDFRGASLFGASLGETANPDQPDTQLDRTTQFSPEIWEQLTPDQVKWLEQRILRS